MDMLNKYLKKHSILNFLIFCLCAMHINNIYSQDVLDDITQGSEDNVFAESIRIISRSGKTFIMTNTNQLLNKGDFITLAFDEKSPVARAVVAKNHNNLVGIKVLKVYSLARWAKLKKGLELQIIKGDDSFLFKVKKEKPDIIISVAFWFPSLYMAIFKSIFKSKLYILTDAIKQTEKNNSTIRNGLRRFIAKHINGFIAGSNLTVSYLQELFPKTKILKSLQTIDVNEWKDDINTLPTKPELRKELGYSDDKISLLSVSNYIPLKNLEKLIDEVALMENCELFLIGEGELKKQFNEKIESLNISHKIKLVNRQQGTQLKKYYKASDVFVFPTNRDTFGYVVLEALASGLPVVCSENAGASSFIENNKNGYVLHPQKDFTTSINRIINNIDSMSKNAVNSISKHTIEKKAETFFNSLTNIN